MIAVAVLALAPAGPLFAQDRPPVDTRGAAGRYEAATAGTRMLENAAGLTIKVLVEASNLGGAEVEVGEITFPVGFGGNAEPHTHGRTEIFYVLEGRLDHIVDDESHVLEPGMVGIVRPGDGVVHRVLGESPVRALVIWAPGGELERIAPAFEVRALPKERSSDH